MTGDSIGWFYWVTLPGDYPRWLSQVNLLGDSSGWLSQVTLPGDKPRWRTQVTLLGDFLGWHFQVILPGDSPGWLSRVTPRWLKQNNSYQEAEKQKKQWGLVHAEIVLVSCVVSNNVLLNFQHLFRGQARNSSWIYQNMAYVLYAMYIL